MFSQNMGFFNIGLEWKYFKSRLRKDQNRLSFCKWYVTKIVLIFLEVSVSKKVLSMARNSFKGALKVFEYVGTVSHAHSILSFELLLVHN